MRLDKFLKVSRLIKRRTVANEACDAGRVLVNGKVAKASLNVKVGDIIEMTLGDDTKKYLVPQASSFTLQANATAGDGFAMHQVGTGILHIGSAKLVKTPVKTYIYEVVAN